MSRQLKAEFYKMFHSMNIVISFLAIVAIVGLSFAFGDMSFFAGGDGMVTYIGFQAKGYMNQSSPEFNEILRSTFAYTCFFWIIVLFITALFFTKEYSTGTIKLAVATGINKWSIYISKVATILCVTFGLYFIYITIFGLIEILQTGIDIRSYYVSDVIRIFILNYLVLAAFICFIVFICVLTRNVGIVVGLSCLYIFAGISIYIMVWDRMETLVKVVRMFIYCNPMYYWMNYCCNRAVSYIELLGYLIVSVAILIFGGYLLEKREIK